MTRRPSDSELLDALAEIAVVVQQLQLVDSVAPDHVPNSFRSACRERADRLHDRLYDLYAQVEGDPRLGTSGLGGPVLAVLGGCAPPPERVRKFASL